MPLTTTTPEPTAGDKLDKIFAASDPLTAELNRIHVELHAINHTPTGRYRTKLKPADQARADKLEARADEIMAELRPLQK